MAKDGGWWSTVPSAAMSLSSVCLLVLVSAACSGSGAAGGDGPIVRLHLSPFDMTATQAVLNITARDPSGQERPFSNTFASGALDPLGVTFPAGTRGPTSYQVNLFSDASCQSATGTAVLNLDSDGVFDLSVPMTTVPYCGNGATLTVDVSSINGGAGTVTSNPPGIACTVKGTNCTLPVMKGTQVTISAVATNGTFAGWSGGSCGSAGSCTLTLNQDTVVQAIFSTCRGWCKEQLPFAVTANLNGVAGTSGSNVLVVGDGGTAPATTFSIPRR